jgi:hypothetical protein
VLFPNNGRRVSLKEIMLAKATPPIRTRLLWMRLFCLISLIKRYIGSRAIVRNVHEYIFFIPIIVLLAPVAITIKPNTNSAPTIIRITLSLKKCSKAVKKHLA